MAVIVSNQSVDIAQELLTQSATYDIFLVHAQDAAFETALAQGYMHALDSASLTEYVQGMYPGIQNAVMREGALFALPLAMAFEQGPSYSPAAFAALGPPAAADLAGIPGAAGQPARFAGGAGGHRHLGAIARTTRPARRFPQLIRQFSYEFLRRALCPILRPRPSARCWRNSRPLILRASRPGAVRGRICARCCSPARLDFDIRVQYRIPVGGVRDKGEGIPLLLSTGAQSPQLLPAEH